MDHHSISKTSSATRDGEAGFVAASLAADVTEQLDNVRRMCRHLIEHGPESPNGLISVASLILSCDTIERLVWEAA